MAVKQRDPQPQSRLCGSRFAEQIMAVKVKERLWFWVLNVNKHVVSEVPVNLFCIKNRPQSFA